MKTILLGRNQIAVLYALRRHGYWRRGCGWGWTHPKETKKILDSLVKRGFVGQHDGGFYYPKDGEKDENLHIAPDTGSN